MMNNDHGRELQLHGCFSTRIWSLDGGRKNLLNRSPSTSVRAPVTEPSPQQPNSAYRALRLMRVMCKFPQFDSRSIVTVTEMDHSRPCFAKSDKHGVGHLRGAECAYWQLRRTGSPMSPNSTRSPIQFPNTTPRQWPWPEITLCPSR